MHKQTMTQTTFEMSKVYQEEAVQLREARIRSKIIHGSGDIDASGDEVEIPFRDFLRRKLPFQYYISQGHIVDSYLRVSSQFDVLIADNNATPILFKGQNGTEYFPYESVYLVGEIKSSYLQSKRYVSAFSKKYQSLKSLLQREATPPTYIGNGLNLGAGLTSGITEPFRNPLFSFMFFVDSGDLTVKAITEEYAQLSNEYLPNIVCFAGGKVLVKAELLEKDNAYQGGPIDGNSHRISSRTDIYWTMYEFTDEGSKGGHALALLMLLIFEHLQTCVLMRPPIGKYMNHILQGANNRFGLIDAGKIQEITKKAGLV